MSRALELGSTRHLPLSVEPADEGPAVGDPYIQLESDVVRELAFGESASEVARSRGHKDVQPEDMLEAMTLDAWTEVRINVKGFVVSYLCELLPSIIAQFLVMGVEGMAAAKNRSVSYVPWEGQSLLFSGFAQDCILRSHWICLAIYLLCSPDDVSGLNVSVLFVLLSFRAADIAVKYSYFADSDLRLLRDRYWHLTSQTVRCLGKATHFDAAGTHHFEMMVQILMAALRAGVQPHLATCKFSISPEGAVKVWQSVSCFIEKVDDVEEWRGRADTPWLVDPRQVTCSKYGRVPEMIGLHDIEEIEKEVANGQVRASLAAYYYAMHEYGLSPRRYLLPGRVIALLFSLVCPVVKLATGGFLNMSLWSTIFYVIRIWILLGAIFLFYLYNSYILLDGMKRRALCEAVLASTGDMASRSARVSRSTVHLPTRVHPELCLDSPGNLRAAWVMMRVLGPELYRGQSMRYSCGAQVMSVVHLAACIGCLIYFGKTEELDWAIACEILFLFLLCVPLLVVAIMYGHEANNSNKRWKKVIDSTVARAVLAGRDDRSAISELAGALGGELERVEPIRILYLEASTEVILLVYAVLGWLSKLVVGELHRQLGDKAAWITIPELPF